MSRPRKGTPECELATKRHHETLLKKFGSEEAIHKHFTEMGRKGGLVKGIEKGFAVDRARAKSAGAKAGAKSKRGHKLIKEEEFVRWYRNNDTGAVIKYIYDFNTQKFVLDEKYMEEQIKNENWVD